MDGPAWWWAWLGGAAAYIAFLVMAARRKGLSVDKRGHTHGGKRSIVIFCRSLAWLVEWREEQEETEGAALGGAHGDARQSADDEEILHGDLGAILRRQMPGGG